MEKAVNRRKRVEGFIQNPQPFFREYDNGNLLNRQNGENTTNTVKHRMHGIHFSAAKRLVHKWSYH